MQPVVEHHPRLPHEPSKEVAKINNIILILTIM